MLEELVAIYQPASCTSSEGALCSRQARGRSRGQWGSLAEECGMCLPGSGYHGNM